MLRISALTRTSITHPFPMRDHGVITGIITEEGSRKSSKGANRKWLQNGTFHLSETLCAWTPSGCGWMHRTCTRWRQQWPQRRWARSSSDSMPSWGATGVDDWWRWESIGFLWTRLLTDFPSSSWWPYTPSFISNPKWICGVLKRSQRVGQMAQQWRGGSQLSATPVQENLHPLLASGGTHTHRYMPIQAEAYT